MDPLSVAASILTIVGAGGSLASGLRRLYALKDAPDALRQLNAELTNIHLLVSAIQDSCRQRGNRVSSGDSCDEFIYAILKRSRDEVLDIEKLIAHELTKVTSNGDKLDKMAWLRTQNKVQRAKESLRETKNVLTGILNVSLVRHLEAQSASIRLGIEEFGRRQKMAEQLIRMVDDTRESQIYDLPDMEQSHALTIDSTIAETSSVLELSSKSSTTMARLKSNNLSKSYHREMITEFGQLESHTSLCFCSCHSRTRLRSPSLLHPILGSLTMGYDSLPFLERSCDNKACRNHSAKSFTASYAFPEWFLRRIITVKATSEVKSGPELLLQVWRVRRPDTMIFFAIEDGNLDLIKRLFMQGEASVLDHAIESGSSQNETVPALISAGADIMQEDQRQMLGIPPNSLGDFGTDFRDRSSPYMLWWTRRLTSGSGARSSHLEIFGALPEPENLGLPGLHAAVLGLASDSFEVILRCILRSSVDQRDSMGRTALHLAALRGDVCMVRKLLVKGADPSTEDNWGSTPLLLWAEYHPKCSWSPERSDEICGSMLDLLSTPEALKRNDYNGLDTIGHVLHFETGVIAALENLKSLGADFEGSGHPKTLYLRDALYTTRNTSAVVRWLLANGSDINRQSHYRLIPTIYAIICRNHKALLLLLLGGSDYSLLDSTGHNLLHFAALYASRKALKVLCQHPLERLCLNAESHDGWTPLKFARWRRDDNADWSQKNFRVPDEDPVQWYNDFKALYRHIAESQELEYTGEDSEEDGDEDSDEDSWEDIDEENDELIQDDAVDSATAGEGSLQLEILGSYPNP